MQKHLHSYLPKTCICNYRLHFNYVIEKERMNNSENRSLEKAGNSKIALIIEDKIYVRSIYIEDHVENIDFSGSSFYVNNYDIK